MGVNLSKGRRAPIRRLLFAVFTTLLSLAAANLSALDIQTLVDNVSATNIENHIRTLAQTPRFTEAELAAAEAYITNELASYGYVVTKEEVLYPGFTSDTLTIPPSTSANVVAELTGASSPEEIFIVGAHFDTVSTSPGADDNASGVAGMLEVARVLAGQNVEKTIRFVGFTFEEVGYLGSALHAQNAKNANENIIGMVSLEMIGYTCDAPNCQVEFKDDSSCPDQFEFVSGVCIYAPAECMQVNPMGITTGEGIALTVNLPSTQLLHSTLQARKLHVSNLEVFAGEVAGDGTCFGHTQRSDHWRFWQQEFPAFMINDTGPFRNHNYHLPDDVPDTVDFEFATRVTKLTLAAVLNFIDPPTALRFHGVTASSFIDRGFGTDGIWLTADDYFFAGMNPTGEVSGYRLRERETGASDGVVGTFVDYSFYLDEPLKLGENKIINDTSRVHATFFEDEPNLVLSSPNVVNSFRGVLENPPMKNQTLTLNSDNTFSRSKRFRYRTTFTEFPIVEENGGYYLLKGQIPSVRFAELQETANLFNVLIAELPVDWQIIMVDHFVTKEPSAPQFTYSNIGAFYSTDPAVIDDLLLEINGAKIPLPFITVLIFGLLLALLALHAFQARLKPLR